MIVTINNKKISLETANNFKTRLIGLMGKKKIENGLIFYTITFNQDRPSCKKNKIIIEIKAKHTLELPKGYIEYLSLQINETLNQLIKL